MGTSTPARPTVYASSIRLPTYGARSASVVPRFDRWKDVIPRFPYPVVDVFDEEPSERRYETLILENDHLCATVLPEIGGRLYSLVEKAAGRELFFRNPVIKPALVASPGAWIAGGLEFNLPFGHNLGGFRPVHTHPVMDGEDRASIVLGQVDRVTGMRWSVELSLERGSRALVQRTTLYNRTPLTQRYAIWSNAAVPVDSATRFLYPMHLTYSDEYPDPVPWPYAAGEDLRLYGSHRRPTSLFDITQGDDFFGVYDDVSDVGLVHWASPSDMPGKKLWTWGTAHDGRIWTDQLTDGGQPYVEIQAGLFEDQRVFELLEPWGSVTVEEVWYPVEGLGTVSSAGRWSAASLSRDGNQLECRLQANATLQGATVSVCDGAGRPLAEPAVRDLAAGHAITVNFDLAHVPPVSRLIVRRVDGERAFECWWGTATEGRLMAPLPSPSFEPKGGGVDRTRVRLDAAEERESPGASRVAAGADNEPSVHDVAEGERLERLGEWARAHAAYMRWLDLGHETARAHAGLARVQLQRGLPRDALRHARGAVSIDPNQPLAHYYAAIASLAAGDAPDARYLLERAWVYELGGQASRVALACLDLAEDRGGVHRTVEAGRDSRYGALRAGALRRKGFVVEALAAAEAVGASDPLEPLAAWEGVLASGLAGDASAQRAAQERWNHDFRESPEAVFLVVADYVSMGWYDDALTLDCAPSLCETTDTVAAWTRLFLSYARAASESERGDRRGGTVSPAGTPDGGTPLSQAPGGGLDPTLKERVLTWAGHQPEHSVEALRLLGELLFDSARPEDAAAAWEAAAERGAADAVLWRNLALVRGARGFMSAAKQAYARATALAPLDARVLEERLLLTLVDDDAVAAANVARQGLDAGLRHTGFRLAALEALLAVGDLDAALEIVTGPHFHMAEGQRWPRYLYLEAWLRAGAASYAAGDFEAAAKRFGEARRFPPSFGIGESEYPEGAQAAYLEGLAWRAVGNEQNAASCFTAAARETHAPDSELAYYVARASAALGDSTRAGGLLRAMLVAAAARLERGGAVDPRGCYLRGLALLGLDRHGEGERWLREAAARERSSGAARAELRRRIDALIPEERLPPAVWWVTDPAGPDASDPE